MSNILENLKIWLCQECNYEFQAIEPYRSLNGQSVCLGCCSESFEVAE